MKTVINFGKGPKNYLNNYLHIYVSKMKKTEIELNEVQEKLLKAKIFKKYKDILNDQTDD